MRRDPSIYLMGEDVGTFGGVFAVSQAMLAEFGETRVVDTPITEAGIVGAGLGSAMVGMPPIVEIMFGDF
jgi:pyruvate/2-oxoglutarate/acetoin dehydrogenase E1 component